MLPADAKYWCEELDSLVECGDPDNSLLIAVIMESKLSTPSRPGFTLGFDKRPTLLQRVLQF